MKYWFIKFSFGALIGLLSIFALSILIDPYAILSTPTIDGINKFKPEFSGYSRIAKPWITSRVKPKSIVIGASSAETGFNPNHSSWKQQPVYNFAIGSGRNYEIYRYLQHAVAVAPVKDVLLGIDFVMYTGRPQPYVGHFSENRLAITYKGIKTPIQNKEKLIDILFSTTYIKSAFKTITNQDSAYYNFKKHYPAHAYKNDGQRIHSSNARFIGSWGTVEDIWKKALQTRYSQLKIIDPKSDPFIPLSNNIDRWDLFKELIEFSHHNSLNMNIVLPPCHSSYLTVIENANMWPWFEEFKRKLVSINENIASTLNSTPFLIMDYCIYHEYTTEIIFGTRNPYVSLKWFWDPNHFKTELGDIVIKEVFSGHTSNKNNFGIPLSSKTINSHLAEQRTKKDYYRKTNKSDIAIINQLIEK